jgi:hypothetical protein
MSVDRYKFLAMFFHILLHIDREQYTGVQVFALAPVGSGFCTYTSILARN